MKSLISACFLTAFILCFLPSFGQKTSWSFGLSAHTSADYFRSKDIPTITGRTQPHSETASSLFSGGGGVWGERAFPYGLALVSNLDYHLLTIHENIFTGGIQKDGSRSDITERQHYITFDLSIRKYLLTDKKTKPFLECGFKADRMIYFKSTNIRNSNTIWNPTNLNAVNPGGKVAAGVNVRKLDLLLEYQYYFGTPLSKDYKAMMEKLGSQLDVSRQNITLKLAYNFMANKH